MNFKKTFATLGLALGIATGAQAANIVVGDAAGGPPTAADKITGSVTWTANNVYYLIDVIYVEPGATLTIEPGTLIRGNADSALVVASGGKIIAAGTEANPIIFTSVNDTPGAPATPAGVEPGLAPAYSDVANEWGNVTIMGDALISGIRDSQGNGIPDGVDTENMEGLTDGGALQVYGGGDDNHDAGTFCYVQLRRGGEVIGFGNELNGMSIGGVGRETDLHHIEIVNNVDDGIEIWGGTVNLKYAIILNIGDDSFDIDQGWRGKAQFVFIVQGYSDDGSPAQGSGVGDNLLELDGSENTGVQPFSAPSFYNFTVIGNPGTASARTLGTVGDTGVEFRDDMRLQMGNSIFMDIGDVMLKDGGSGGDGGGYAAVAGSPTWASLFSTPVSTFSAEELADLAAAGVTASDLYHYTSGNWIQFTDCIFFNKKPGDGTLGANGVLAAQYNNQDEPAMPIVSITRGAAVTKGGISIVPLATINPRAANTAVTSVGTAPADGFFTQAPFIGAFSKDVNWALGWTAMDSYGFFVGADTATDPATTVNVTTLLTFTGVSGVVYTVESSTDGINWSPFATVVGDGSSVSVADLAGFDSTKLYRVIAQ